MALVLSRKEEDNGQCLNIYDVRLVDSYPSCGMNWPPNIRATYDYLHRADVRAAFHVDGRFKPEAWVECNARVGRALNTGDDVGTGTMEPASVTLLPGLLAQNVEVLIYAGDQDLICNYLGLEKMLDHLSWSGGQGFSQPANTAGKTWYLNDQAVGKWVSERKLTYVRVYNASHMVPFDAPLASHDMMLRFMNVSLLDAAGPLARIPSRIGEGGKHGLVWGPTVAQEKGEGQEGLPGSGVHNATNSTLSQDAIDQARYDAY